MSFEKEKIVHVNAYTRDDGTKVKEHYRGLNTSSNGFAPGNVPQEDNTPPDSLVADNPLDKVIDFLTGKGEGKDPFTMNASSNIVLNGGVSTTHFDFSNIWSAVVSVASIAVSAGIAAAQVAGELYKAGLIGNSQEKAQLKPQLNTEIKKMKETQNLAEKIEKKNLDKLVAAKDPQEYSKLYKTLAAQRDLNTKNRIAITKIEHAFQNDDYETVINELNTYQANYENAEVTRAISAMPSMTPQTLPAANPGQPQYSKLKQFKRTSAHGLPELQKSILGGGIKFYDIFQNSPDANALWKASAEAFTRSSDYIKQNGYLVNSVNQLQPDLQSFVSQKLQQQIGSLDAKGIIYKPDSRLSQEIVHSPEFKDFLDKNFSQIINGEVVNGSTYFSSSNNLKLALGHADIRNVHIDSNGNLKAYVIDTYDFNKNDPMWEVEWAHNLQELGKITNFYTINVLFIPKEIWTQIILS